MSSRAVATVAVFGLLAGARGVASAQSDPAQNWPSKPIHAMVPLAPGTGGDVVVHLNNADGQLHIRVINDGISLDPNFELNNATGLGLSIVRTLVTTELAGRISMRSGLADDFVAVGLAKSARATGTVVDLTVPV